MRAVIQRVSCASVSINGRQMASIEGGLLVLLGVAYEDTQTEINRLVGKIVNMRIFEDENGVMNRSVKDTNGDMLVVSQFTLMANCKKGNRPSYINAAKPDISMPLYQRFCEDISKALGKPIATGQFGADMKIKLINNGPVTIVLDTASL